MNPEFAKNWYTFEEVRDILQVKDRTARERLASVPDQLVREEPGELGRPRKLYHATAFAQLHAWHAMNRANSESETTDNADPTDLIQISAPSVPSAVSCSSSSAGPAADDLAIAQLRLLAVWEYNAAAEVAGRLPAARVICEKWRKHPQTRTVTVVERLSGWDRKVSKSVSVGCFGESTLRAWAALYKEREAAGLSESEILLSLAPERKGHAGRKGLQIPDDLVDFVRLLAVSTVRADIAKAVEKARPHLPPQFRNVSLSTWRRKILARDPRKASKDLMHSISRFRANHTPDVEIDWEKLPYNGRWEIDDVEKDWYAMASREHVCLRPHGYAIMRVRTRQWVAFVATETDINHDQVRELIGFAMANPMGGIPDTFKFERGTTACKPDLERLLTTLGAKVLRTSMDGGAAITGLVQDVAKGHFQGKGVIEANFRRDHNLEWDMPGQVGPDERNTAPARLENLKALAREARDRGEFLPFLRPEQWYPVFLTTMEKHNNRPHSGLPEIVDPDSGKPRHMTPNEMAWTLKDQPIRMMDAKLLPLFAARAEKVPVTRNGCLLNSNHYGRFDEELQKFREVTLYASKNYPAIAYCHELGRCLNAYVKSEPGASDQFEAKRRMEQNFRNGQEELAAKLLESDKAGVFDVLMAARNPTPDRIVLETVCPVELLQPAQGLEAGISAHKEGQARADARFVPATASEGESSRGHGLLRKAADLDADVDMLRNPQSGI